MGTSVPVWTSIQRRIHIGWNESKGDWNVSWVHFWVSFASESSVRCVDFMFASNSEAWCLSPCGLSFVDVVAFLLHCAICCLICAWLKGLCNCLSSTRLPNPPPCSYFFPHEVSLIFLGRKALLEIAYFINCLVTLGVECWILVSFILKTLLLNSP